MCLAAAVAGKSLRAACARRSVAPEVGTVTFFEVVGDFVGVGGIGGFHLASAFLITVGRNQTDSVGLGVAVGRVAAPDSAVGFVKLKLQCIGRALGMRKQPWGVL